MLSECTGRGVDLPTCTDVDGAPSTSTKHASQEFTRSLGKYLGTRSTCLASEEQHQRQCHGQGDERYDLGLLQTQDHYRLLAKEGDEELAHLRDDVPVGADDESRPQ